MRRGCTTMVCRKNCSTGTGLRLWLDVLCCVRQGGSVWFGTQRGSFLRMCLHTSKRSHENDYIGDESRPFVKEGNRQMAVTALLAFLAHLLGLHFVLEQPLQSVLPLMEPLKSVLAFTGATRTGTWLGQFGGSSPKPLQLWHSNKFGTLKRCRPKCKLEGGKRWEKLVTKLKGKRFRGIALLSRKARCIRRSSLLPSQALLQTA